MQGRFDHTGLNVLDLAAMTRWYCEAFGMVDDFTFELPQVDFRGVMLRHPQEGYRIELLHREGTRPGIQAGTPVEAALTLGFSHFALDVESVDETFSHLVAAGATERMSPRPSPEPGVRVAFVADPEGNLIEILDRAAAVAAGRAGEGVEATPHEPEGPSSGPSGPTTTAGMGDHQQDNDQVREEQA